MKRIIDQINPNRILRNFKIRNKITIIFSLMIILVISSLSYFYYYYSTNLLTEKSVSYTRGILEQISNNIDINLKQIEMSSHIISYNISVLNTLKYGRSRLLDNYSIDSFNMKTLLYDVMFSRNDISSICVYDRSGNQWNTVEKNLNVDFDNFYKQAERGEGKFIFLETELATREIPAVRLIRNMNIEPVGIMVVNIRESSINEVFSKEIEKIKGEVYVTNEKNKILSSTDSSHIGTTIERNISDKLEDRSGYALETIDGEKCIITYYPSGYNRWKYISVIPLKAITTETAYIGKVSAIMCVVAVIVFVLLTYVVVSGITVPITKMTQYMRDVKIKEWTPRMHYEGNDEIAFMSESFNEMVTRINTLIEELYEQKYRQKKHELQALQAQINPHFLNNTLEIVNCMALSRNAPEIGDMVKALARMMRYSMNFKESIVTIEKELQHLKNYMFIQCEKNADRIKVIYDIDERIFPYRILKLSLQPIAENAIIHAFKNTRNEKIIAIDGSFINEKIRIRITDNGAGMDQKTIAHLLNDEDEDEAIQSNNNHTGIGMGNVNRRLKLTFGEEYGLKVISEVLKGTIVEVWLPTQM